MTAGCARKCLAWKLFGTAKIREQGIDTLEDSDPDDGGLAGKLVGDKAAGGSSLKRTAAG